MRILGLDIGDKRIGAAVSDELGITAQPLSTIIVKSGADAIGEIRALIDKWKITEVVAGLPLSMDGSSSERTLKTREFLEELKKNIAVPLKTRDERLSSSEVERVMISAGVRRNKRKAASDRLAAQVILQGYLDSKGRPDA